MKESTRKSIIRKVMIKDSDNDLTDELVRHRSDSDYKSHQRHERHHSNNNVSGSRRHLTTFSLLSVIEDKAKIKFNITCLICKRQFACCNTRSTFLQKKTAWGDWRVPHDYINDIRYLRNCLCEKKAMCSDYGSLNSRTGKKEQVTDNVDLCNFATNEKYQAIFKEPFELTPRIHRMKSSPNREFEGAVLSKTSGALLLIGFIPWKLCLLPILILVANLFVMTFEGFAMASVSNINVNKFEMKKTGNNVAGEIYGTESENETFSSVFPGSNERMASYPLSGSDGLLQKEINQKYRAVVSKHDVVNDLTLEFFGRKAMEKPQMMRKTGLMPPISRLIKKNKVISDKSDTNNGGISGVKFLSASARKRLLIEVNGMDKKVRERILLRLVQSYDDEHCIAKSSEDYKGRLLESIRKSLYKESMKEDGAVDLKTSVKDENFGSTRKIVNQEKRSDREIIYIPETRTVISFSTVFSGSTNRKGKLSAKKIEQDVLAQLWSKQTLTAAISKQLIEQGTVFNVGRAYNVEKQKSAQTTSSKKGRRLDVKSNSTDIDLSVDLGEFDINTFSEEVRKLHEEGKLKKFLKQALGMRQSASAKVSCESDYDKRVEGELKVPKKESFGYQTNNIDDPTDDNEDKDEEWSECEAPDEQHPQRHYSCNNETKNRNRKTVSGSDGDGWHGHCDCCYCEMFGHATTESVKSGRAQIRERLRMKLKRRTVQERPGTGTKSLEKKMTYSTTNEESKKLPIIISDAPIEEILDYINEKDNAATQAATSKAAKRARKKLRKQEEKEKQSRERKFRDQKRVTETVHPEKKKQTATQQGVKKEQQATKQDAKKEKQIKLEAKKKKSDRVRGKKQKDGRDRKENEHDLSGSQNIEVWKEPVLEFEYWNDLKCDPEFKQLGSTKEQMGNSSKIRRTRTQNKVEPKKNEDVLKRSKLCEKREYEKENASAKKGAIEVEKNDTISSKKENDGVKSEGIFSVNSATMSSKTDREGNVPRYPLETSLSSMQSAVPSLRASSVNPSTCVTTFSVRDFDVSFKGNTKTTRMPYLGVTDTRVEINLCNDYNTAQNLHSTSTVTQGSTVPCSCRKQSLPNAAIPSIAGIEIQKSPQCISTEFPFSHQNGTTSIRGSIDTVKLNKIKSGGTSPGSSHLTAVAYAKRDEASKTFSSSSPFADFDSETWKLAVLSDGIPKKQNPMIFEPGDPRIAAAIADMKFDPNEVFKPRPGSELEFLDPLELEVEHFKRIMWEEQLTKPRMPLRGIRKIDPKNEPNAVFHFAPLV